MGKNKQEIALFCAQHRIAYQDALAHLSDNKSIYVTALDIFINDLTSYIKQTITLPFIPANFTLMLHTLKSSAATLGFTELALYAKKYEHKLIDYQPTEFSHFTETLLAQLQTYQKLATMFMPMLKNDLQSINHHQKKPILTVNNKLAVDNEFIQIFVALMEEVNHYNMNATNTFMKIAATLELIAPQHIELLTLSINQLKFQQAETLLAEIYPLLTHNQS